MFLKTNQKGRGVFGLSWNRNSKAKDHKTIESAELEKFFFTNLTVFCIANGNKSIKLHLYRHLLFFEELFAQ